MILKDFTEIALLIMCSQSKMTEDEQESAELDIRTLKMELPGIGYNNCV